MVDYVFRADPIFDYTVNNASNHSNNCDLHSVCDRCRKLQRLKPMVAVKYVVCVYLYFFCFLLFAVDGKKYDSGSDIICCDKDMEPLSCSHDCEARTCASLKKKTNSENCSRKCHGQKCFCKSGLYLNKCNKCVPEQQCDDHCKDTPIKCPGLNEQLEPCFDPNLARNCQNWLNETACTPNSPREVNLYDTDDANAWWPQGQCILNVCDCEPGFFRNKCGICVGWPECDLPCNVRSSDPCSDPNEKRYKKWRECDERTCVNLKYPMKQDERTLRVHVNKCDCKPGYYRDNCGRCVPKAECEDQRPCKCTNPCKADRQVLRCINSCTKQTCAKTFNPPLKCKKLCYDACDCKDNFQFNKNGVCVSRFECTTADIEATARDIRDDDVISEGRIIEIPEGTTSFK